jgi:hypothetical protein
VTMWSYQQVRIMESYRFQQIVSNEQIYRAGWEDDEDDVGTNPAVQYTLDHLFHALREAGRTWALEIDRNDCAYTVTDESDIDAVRITLQWAPTTRAGLLIGGPAGGTCYAFDDQNHRRGVLVQVLDHRARDLWVAADLDRVAASITDPNASPVVQVQAPVVKEYFYQYCGWTEARRMWVYRVATQGE